MTKVVDALVGTDGLIRWSKIQAHLAGVGEHELAKKVADDIERIGRTCDTHGYLEDPIVFVEPIKNQLIIACPFCSSPELLAQWEAQGNG